MASIEKSIKAQFERKFVSTDWFLFKAMAELNLKQAAKLKKKDMPIAKKYQLVARNSRKRLLIGVGVELLLKSIYLKRGYLINKPKDCRAIAFPFKMEDAREVELVAYDTYSLAPLIDKLPKVLSLTSKAETLRGLRIAKVFRNKEGHGVTRSHDFDASNYSDIVVALVALYRDAFDEEIEVQFSMSPNEKAVWRVSPILRRRI